MMVCFLEDIEREKLDYKYELQFVGNGKFFQLASAFD